MKKSLNESLEERDSTIIKLWNIFNALSYEQKIDDWSDEDLNLWTYITAHSAVQNKL